MRGIKYARAGRSTHHTLASPFAEDAVEVLFVPRSEVVIEERLAAELVDALGDLVAGGVAQSREEGEEAAGEGRVGVLAEDDGGEGGGGGFVAHEAFGDGVDGVENGQLGNTGRAFDMIY